jgi:hypothetical protein
MKGANMKNALVLLVVGMLAGCVRPPVPVFKAERIADGKADGLAGKMWGKVEYAPKQYAGFVYDSTGVYANLHGVGPPEILALQFYASKGHKGMLRRRICLFAGELMGFALDPPDSNVIHATPAPALPEGQFKWLGRPRIAKRAWVYGRTFWISWKALGLDGPPAEGQISVFICAMQRKGKGASFRVDAKNTR